MSKAMYIDHKPLTIEVTGDDISRGKIADSESCAVALACERAGIERPSVVAYTIMEIPTKRFWSIPRWVRQWTARFDNREPVLPISFTAVPDEPA